MSAALLSLSAAASYAGAHSVETRDTSSGGHHHHHHHSSSGGTGGNRVNRDSQYGAPVAPVQAATGVSSFGAASAPVASYGAPSASYGAPAQSYAAPAQSYGAPSYSATGTGATGLGATGVGATGFGGGAASTGYAAPSYNAPAPSYNAPSYNAPSYNAPSYNAPSYNGGGGGDVTGDGSDLTTMLIPILALIGLSLLFPSFVAIARKKRSADDDQSSGESGQIF